MAIADTSSTNPLLERLQELEHETDFEFVVELIDIYLNETPKQIQLITDALKAQDRPALIITSHTLKGSSLNLGAKHMGVLCSALEELGRSDQPIPGRAAAVEIEKEFEKTLVMLNTYKQSKS
jgi:HPt (histidine-containing phosphotransfer) domain-containing protein